MKELSRQKWNIVSLIPAILVIVAIFYFCLQPGDVSDSTSAGVGSSLVSLAGGRIVLSKAQMDTLNNLLRILAHFMEYGALAVCLAWAATRNGIRRHLRAVYMCGVCLFISLVDEFVQIFVPGRYGDPRDMAVDMMAVVLLAGLTLKLRKTRALPREERVIRRDFLNTQLDDITFDEAVDRIMEYAGEDQERCRLLVTPNADHIIKLEKDEKFREVYENADLITTDGTPLLWIADSYNVPICEKVTGADLLPAVCKRAAAEGRSMFFLTASDELLVLAVSKLEEMYPDLNIIGGFSPPMGFGKDKENVEWAIRTINDAAPDILVVGVGAPKSEKFIYENRDRIHARVALPIGAAVAFLVGGQKRAPQWMRRFGLEWFYRFLQEPGRLFKRYFVEDMKIFFLALKYRDRTVNGYLHGRSEQEAKEDKEERQ